jgi:predicted transcriptional regulator
MSELNKRATVYFDPDIHKALKIKAAVTNKSISEFIDQAVKNEFADDEEDIRSIRERASESTVPFEKVLKDLKSNGKI